MKIALIAKDKPGALEIRKSNRDAHVAYLKATDAMEMAGPFLDENGEMCGSLIILNMDMAAAQEWAANDPYKKADLFDSVELITWNKVLG
ncbi:YciI-like protein [Shimia thalassica]|uniref:YciI-like protein n=1 Tax=Shimia thalassica TaxID=1715693 RepID=A0A0P1INW8_9RHOB|nr:YciI family protein [Shimia thalassica]CUK09802.1 YciI-like protein [Shimia thalassica]